MQKLNGRLSVTENPVFKNFINKYGISLVAIGMFLIMSIVSKDFLKIGNLTNILNNVALNGVLALGMCFVITVGGIDLTVGSQLALASVSIGLILQSTENNLLACIVSIVACSLLGLINGLLITRFNMVPFVVTLAMQLVIRGMGYVISGGYSFALATVDFTQIGLGKLFGVIPYPILMMLGVAIIAYILMHCTKFGRYVYAVGGNINSAIVSGVNVKKIQTLTYMFSGFCCGVAGIIITTRINAAQPNIGTGYETDAIAACVIGGTSFAGGEATIPGTLIGIVIIGMIYNGMNLLGVNSYWQTIVKGLLIILAVLLDTTFKKKRK